MGFIRPIDAVPLEERDKMSEFLNMVSFSKPVAKAGVMRRKMLEVHLVENLTFKKTESEVRSLTHVSH